MKSVLALAFLLSSGLAQAGTISFGGRDVIRIEVDEDSNDYDTSRPRSISELTQENKRLKKRLKRLEEAVRQLQDRTFSLEASNVRVSAPQQRDYTCYIKTNFRGTVIGKGSSEMEARARAIQACTDKDGGFDCEDHKVKCGNN